MRTYGAVDLRSVAATPAVPVSDAVRLYAKTSDGKLYTLNAAGVETVVGSGAGGGGGSGPVGTISMWGGATPPGGYLICNGGTFLSTTYPDLAVALGDTFGTHSGTTYFLPDFQARSPIGVGAVVPTQGTALNFGLATKWGNEMTTLTAQQLPKHAHGAPSGTAGIGGVNDRFARGVSGNDVNFRTDTTIFTSNAYGSAEAGTQTTVPMHHPTLAVTFIIKALADTTSSLLGFKEVTTGTQYVAPTTGVDTDVDAANAAITFTVPSSGEIIFSATGLMEFTGTGVYEMTVREGTTTVAVATIGAGPRYERTTVSMPVRGLTPGTVKTYKLGWRSLGVVNGQLSIYNNYGGGHAGILLTVEGTGIASTGSSGGGGGVIGSTGFRNALRNGDFSVAQRGNGPFNTGYGLDGWLVAVSALNLINVTRNTLSLTDSATIGGARYEAQCAVTNTAAAGDYVVLQSVIEDVRTLAGKQVTLSFWAYGSVANKIGIEVQQNFGTGGSPSAAVFAAVIPIQVTTGWSKYSTTFTVPAVSGKTLGTSGSEWVAINFWLSAGSTQAARASNIGIQNWTVHLADVQLEEGPTATNFERIPVQQQLAWCQRYFYRWVGTTTYTAAAIGTAWTATSFYAPFRLPVPMRVPPTFGSSAGTTFFVYGGSGNAAPTSLLQMERNTDVVELAFTTAAAIGAPVGGSAWLRAAVAGAYLDFSAEL